MTALEKLHDRAAKAQARCDELETLAAAREGDAAGSFTDEEVTEYEGHVATLKAVKAQADRLKARNVVDIQDWMDRRGVEKPGQLASGEVAGTFDDGARITDETRGGPFGAPESGAFGKQLKAIKEACRPGGVVDPRLLKVAGPTGAAPAVGEDGGFLIQTETMPGILKHAQVKALLYPRVPNTPIGENANRLEFTEVDDYDQSLGLTQGGVKMYWRADADTVPKTKPQVEPGEMKLHDLMGLAYATDNMLEDVTSYSAWLEEAFGEATARAIDDAIFGGSGVGRPLGFASPNNGSLIVVPKEDGQDADTVEPQNFINMLGHVPAEMRDSLVWLVGLEIEGQLPGMQMGSGGAEQLIYMPPGGLTASPYARILGYPVIPFRGAKKLGDQGDVVLAALGAYRTISKGRLKKDVSMHVRFDYAETGFRFKLRMNGRPMWKKPLTPENVNTGFKQSPFVTLAARA